MTSDERPYAHGPADAIVRAILGRLAVGELTVHTPGRPTVTYRGDLPGPSAEVRILHPRAMRRLLLAGSVGLAEGYMEGEWDTPDLPAVLRLGLANLPRPGTRPLPELARPLRRAQHRLRANTRRGSKRNISYHYDLGNGFYELWLDDTMTYSCALFESAEDAETRAEDLECAQRRKWDRLLELLQPTPRDHLLEIGCGWGGFAMHAAREAGCRVTGVTISEQQHDRARDRVAQAGLDGQVEIRLQDYRDVRETFSGIASIEMFEAVGERYWPVFFGRVRELLADGGRAAIQTITILDEKFERYRARPDFVQRYIFPGGMLPSPERFLLGAARAGLEPDEPRFFGLSYARTLERWLDRFDEVHDEVLAMGFDERFVRMWRYYLAYCRTGFEAGDIDVMQVALEPVRR